MRALATIRVIEAINPIPNADAIDVASIGGWNVVVKKGAHQVGEKVVYLEIDSWVPEHLAPFLNTGSPAKEFEGVVGYRLRTKKLRGVVSQGLILPTPPGQTDVFNDGDDLTELLNIKKYEKPVNAQLAGIARGNFPSFIPKTDQERIQNLKRDLNDWNAESLEFEVTEKVDGSSCTVYYNSRLVEDGKEAIGVCSRNLDLKETEGNSFWSVARSSGAIAALETLGENLAIQGELAGPGVQGNQYKLPHLMFFVFDIFDIDAQKYYTAADRDAFCKVFKLTQAPVVYSSICLALSDDRDYATVESLLTMAEGESKLNALYGSGQSTREGLVFKCISDPSISFKAISNKWLIKYEE